MEGKLTAVEGDIDTHNALGQLIQQYGDGSIFINGKKMIVAQGDKAAPDVVGMLIHPFCPTDPAQGASTISAYGGKAGGGLGNLLGGNLNIGEMVSMNGQAMGMIKNFTNNGNGTGSIALQNMGSSTPSAGQTLVGQETGNSITLTSFTRSDDYDTAAYAPNYPEIMEVAITDDYGVIALNQYFTGLPSQDYQSTYVVTL